MTRKGLFVFTNDCRMTDNPALLRAAEECDTLLCIYALDPGWLQPHNYACRPLGSIRERFLLQTLQNLQTSLIQQGQHLHVRQQALADVIPELITQVGVEHIYYSRQSGWNEQQQFQWLRDRYPQIHFTESDSFTLYRSDQLRFPWSHFPETFSQFRKQMEPVTVCAPLPAPKRLPPPPPVPVELGCFPDLPELSANRRLSHSFTGGEDSALAHLSSYFASAAPGHYKQVRNELDGWDNSTKFSAWLANGCLSARTIVAQLKDYESRHGANDSTYWIFFELLWREFFQWYAQAHGIRLFRYRGIRNKPPLTSFYPERYRKWCAGTTPSSLVNACMHQLNETGYMSNRGRQLVASYFVNELALDWRYGAAYFEQQLIDYDVGSNWGNWQYLAGVGADPRGHRHFDIDKQARQYDPDGEFVRRWRGHDSTGPLDSVDAADWPLG